jgi:hypothetical protein
MSGWQAVVQRLVRLAEGVAQTCRGGGCGPTGGWSFKARLLRASRFLRSGRSAVQIGMALRTTTRTFASSKHTHLAAV